MQSLFVHSPLGLNGAGSVGTAFICRVNNERYLVTAAHVPSGQQHVDGKFQIPAYILVKSENTSLRVDLLNADGSERFISHNPAGTMSDILILRMSPGALFQGINEHPLHLSPSVPNSGDQLLMFGFPGCTTATPSWPENVTRLVVVEASESKLNTLEEIIPGASGAPCLTRDGQLAGMAIGSTRGMGTLIGAPLIREMIIRSQGRTAGGTSQAITSAVIALPSRADAHARASAIAEAAILAARRSISE